MFGMFPVLGALGLLYWLTAATTVLGADNGEFCTLFATGGVAHPSGYPLYVLLLRAFAWLPAPTPAHGAAIVTAGIGLGAAVLLFHACRAWGSGASAAALAAVVYALSPVAWDLSTQAEVFALNAAIAAAILWLAAPEGPARGVARVAWLGALAGLGLSDHHTIVLLAPVGLYGAALGARESTEPLRAWLLGAGALLLGLLPYGTLPLFARGDPLTHFVWGDVTTLRGIVAHFRRADYGTTTLALGNAPLRPLAQLMALARRLFVDLRVVPPLIGVAVLVAKCAGRGVANRTERVAFVSLAAAFLLAGPLFVLFMNVPATPEGAAIVRRFHLLPALLLCVPFAVGAEALLGRASALLRGAAIAGVICLDVWLGLPGIANERRPMLENYVLDTLATVPENAVVFGSGDERVFGFLYAKLGLGVRRDVTFVSPILLHYGWYHRRVEAELGMTLPGPKHGSISTVDLAATVLSHGRPLFLADAGTGAILRAFATFPVGTVIVVLPPGASPPPPDALERTNVALYARYRIDPSVRNARQAWTAGPRQAYARPWYTLAAAFGARGDAAGAARNADRAAAIDVPR